MDLSPWTSWNPYSVSGFSSMWFQFDPSQNCFHFSWSMSNCTNAIILCVIKVTTDDISGWLPTKCTAVGWTCMDNAASHSGSLAGSLLASFRSHHMWRHSSFSHIITQSIEFPFLIFAKLLAELSCTVGICLPVHLTNCGADGRSNSSNILSFPKAVGESLWLMAPPWADHHPSLPLSVARRPSAERRPTWDPFGEHICQMTARSVYHPLWLRQIHCHREPHTLA